MRGSRERGAVTVEVALGAVLLLFVVGLVIDYGLMVHRQSLLLDITLKTVQDVSRDPLAAESEYALEDRAREIFAQHAERLAAGRASELVVVGFEFSCLNDVVSISTEWPTLCAYCVGSGLKKVLHAQSGAMVESPGKNLCS